MRIYLKENVLEATLQRIRRIFDEFEHVVVDCSGGKDSTVILNLALQVAIEKERLPLPVCFLDQEAEWDSTISYMRTIMYDDRIEPLWIQCPFKLFNATSPLEPWLVCWEPGKEDLWIRPQEPISIKENVYGTDRFTHLYGAILKHHYPGKKACHLTGIRCEESPARLLGMSTYTCYQDVTWGKKESKTEPHYSFAPIYDWGTKDVWKAIHSNSWSYSSLYDSMYQYGIPIQNMRVSNVHHETAIRSMFFLQEIEADCWNRITARLQGVNTAGQLGSEGFMGEKLDLPYMFESWIEYRDHLLENLIVDPEAKKKFRKQFAGLQAQFDKGGLINKNDDMYKTEIRSILVNDTEGTKLKNWRVQHRIPAKFREAKPE